MIELKTLRALFELLNPAERWSLAVFTLLLVVSGGLEVLGLGTIFLFTGILNELSTGTAVPSLIWGFDWGVAGWPVERFALAGGFALILVFIFKAAILLGIQVAMMRFIFGAYRRFSVNLLAAYLQAPLTFHLEHGLAKIQRNLTVQTGAVFNAVAASLAYIASNVIAIACLFTVLCFIDPFASLLALLLQATVGGLYYISVRRSLLAFGRQRHVHVASAIRWVSHAISGIREVRLIGAEPFFLRGFDGQVRAIASADCNIRIASFIPGIVNEGALVVGIVGLMLLYLSSGRSLPELMPVLAAFGFAGVRIMGMAASIISHVQQLQFHGPAVQSLRAVGRRLRAEAIAAPKPSGAELTFCHEIRLDRIEYRYPDASHPVLNGVSLDIPKNSRTALLGPSGSGKTTLLSILLGLLEPALGAVLVDGTGISANPRSWFAKLAYVPQSIFILDDTVQANVLFGRDSAAEGTEAEIWMALETAQIAGLVRSLPFGLQTVLGESGAKLSGGERQRIGIARALLRRPELLVLDEATSALDRDTERKLLDAIMNRYRDMTLVTATHRVEAVRSYARRYMLRDGLLVELGGADDAARLEHAAG